MTWSLVLVPALAGLAAFVIRAHAVRRALLVAAAAAHLALALAAWRGVAAPAAEGWLAPDAAGLLFLTITSVLFAAAAVYAAGYLAREAKGEQPDIDEALLFVNQPEAVFTGCLLLFLATMSLVCLSRHMGMIWVGIEATTLCSAPLIYYHRHHRSLEAAWKYLLICSVGIALALLGNFFLAVAFAQGGAAGSLHLAALLDPAAGPNGTWLRVAFALLLVGYGTKMGLAPMHTWLPDAHSEAPSVVSALLSGALLNVAFLGLLRAWQILAAAGEAAFAAPLMLAFGLLSMGIAAAFILGQRDYKRMLAYSSVEHMGILAAGIGLGGGALFGSLLHAANHSLVKAMLFLVAGNILAAFRTKSCAEARGVQAVLPVSGALWVGGFLAITGAPPFGVFLSKFIILRQAFAGGHAWSGALMLAFVAAVFVGMCRAVLGMAQGRPAESLEAPRPAREALWAVVPPLALGAAALALGVWLPAPLERLLAAAAAGLGGPP